MACYETISFCRLIRRKYEIFQPSQNAPNPTTTFLKKCGRVNLCLCLPMLPSSISHLTLAVGNSADRPDRKITAVKAKEQKELK